MNKWLIVGLVGLVSCREGSSSRKEAPSPGAMMKPQIYVLSDAEKPLGAFWGFPAVEILSEKLNARVEYSQEKTEQDFEKKLRDWNARPAQLLILGPGRPQQLYRELELTRSSRRKTLFVGGLARAQESGAWGVEIAEKDVRRAHDEFCREKDFRDFCREKNPLRIQVKWDELLRDFLQGRGKTLQKVDFFSGYLVLEADPHWKAEKQRRFEEWKKKLMLEFLAGGSAS